ncbi:unnamed protein product, partial [Laminaria digitata]
MGDGDDIDEEEEYVYGEHGGEDDGEAAAADVRSGRLDTLGWVSASWEPRCVVLRTDGSMSVQPLGSGRKLVQQRQQHRRASAEHARGGGGAPASASPAESDRAAKMKGERGGTSASTGTERMTSW